MEASSDKLPAGVATNVTLSVGPNGLPNGSYYFHGSYNSHIYIPLYKYLEVEGSMTIILWFYPEKPGVILSYSTGLEIYVTKQETIAAKLKLKWETKTYLLESKKVQLSSWMYVAFWYDYYNGVIGLRVSNQTVAYHMIVKERPILIDSNIKLGASFHGNTAFQGKITNL